MSLMPHLLHLATSPARRRWKKALAKPEETQANFLHNLLETHALTGFGKEHRFAQIHSYEDYCRQVPIRTYEQLRPYMNRLIEGEPYVLFSEPLLSFNRTSGTTREPKLIPVTATQERLQAEVTRLWLAALAKDHPEAFAGKYLAFTSPEIETHVRGIPCGSTSGRMYRSAPRAMRQFYVLPYALSEVVDYEQRYWLSLRLALAEEVSIMVTPNPTTLLRLAEIAEQNFEDLLRCIHDGTLNPRQVVPECLSLQAEFELYALKKSIRPDPARARVMAQRMAQPGEGIGKLWPKLSVIGCWLGGSVGLQVPRLREAFGQNIHIRDIGFLASEGRVSLPMRDGTADGCLSLRTNFYEFWPAEETPDDGQRLLLAHELAVGQQYNLYLSNQSGLYRYDIQDVVEVSAIEARVPELHFVRKSRDISSITGEKIHADQVMSAVRAAEQNLKTPLQQFRAWAEPMELCYVLGVELGASPSLEHLTLFLTQFDDQLAANNLEYASKRASGRLRKPRLALMQKGWHEAERRRQFQSGKRDVQFKWNVLLQEQSPHDQAYIQQTIELR